MRALTLFLLSLALSACAGTPAEPRQTSAPVVEESLESLAAEVAVHRDRSEPPLNVVSLSKLIGEEINARKNEWPINEQRLAEIIRGVLLKNGVQTAWKSDDLAAEILRYKRSISNPKCASRLKSRTSSGNPECKGRLTRRGGKLTIFASPGQ